MSHTAIFSFKTTLHFNKLNARMSTAKYQCHVRGPQKVRTSILCNGVGSGVWILRKLVGYSFKIFMVGRDSREYLAQFLHFLGVESDSEFFITAQGPIICVRARAEGLCLNPGPGTPSPYCRGSSFLLRQLCP